MTVLRTLAVFLLAMLAAAPGALAQTGQQKYTQWCQGCHGNPSDNKDGVLGGKDWNIIKLAMDTKPTMTADLRPAYNAGLLTDDDFMLIAGYLQTFQGGVTSQLAMPAAVSFGSVAVGVGSSLVTRQVTSIGNAAVQLSSTVASSNPLEFTVVSTTCTAGAYVLPPNGTCSITLQFTPAASGARSGQINVVSNGIGSPQSFAVSGTGGTGGPPPQGTLSVPASVNLGSQNVGVQSAGTGFSLLNPSGTAVTVSSIVSSSASEFPVVGNTCGTVPAGGSCNVTVAFRPAAAGSRTGSVTVTSNGTGSPQSIPLSGTGTVTPPPPSGLSVPSSLSLGSQIVGVQTAGSPLIVSNPGASPITVSSIVSSSVSEFPIVGNTCGIVSGGSSCTITVAFRPLTIGSRVGSVTITSNGTGSPNVVSLSGTGTSAPAVTKVPVVEYHNAGFGHYFMTADADEIAGLDAGAYNFAFVRTGRVFNAYAAPGAGTVPVCRFFTLTFAPKSSHFYTADPVECEGLKSNPNWQYEKIAFHIAVPGGGGACPMGTSPIYRMYNNGQTGAPNHRFASDFSIYQDFTTTKNWWPEGTGFCSPP